MNRSTAALRESVRVLLGQLRSQTEVTLERWRPLLDESGSYAVSARNLAAYLALRRHHDLRELQLALMTRGLSSLGRCESRVDATIAALDTTLAVLAGDTRYAEAVYPPVSEFHAGENLLSSRAGALFGGEDGRVMVTLDTDAGTEPEVLRRLVEARVDCVRINCAHDDQEIWGAMLTNLARAQPDPVARPRVLMDLGGPKIRTGSVTCPEGQRRLAAGDVLLLRRTPPDPEAKGFQAECATPAIVDALRVGDRVVYDDGRFTGRVVEITEVGAAIAVDRAGTKGAKLAPEKGLAFPDVDLALPSLTAKDIEDLDFVARHADMVGYSFVQSPEDVAVLQDELAARRSDWRSIGIVAKIETARAVRNTPRIIVQAASRQPFAVMIARGDLAMSLGFERTAEIQEELGWLCEAAHVPVIWATEVLAKLVGKGISSRGEATDAAIAARSECVMLNKGAFVLDAVATVRDLQTRMRGHYTKKFSVLRPLRVFEE